MVALKFNPFMFFMLRIIFDNISAAGEYQIIAEESSESPEGDFIVTRLLLTHNGESRTVTHYHFVSWPDYGVPDSAMSMLTFLQRVREKQAELLTDSVCKGTLNWTGHELGVHHLSREGSPSVAQAIYGG